MDSATLQRLHETFTAQGSEATIEHLCNVLHDAKDYTNLFYALLMKKRHELGISLIPIGPTPDLPRQAYLAYEEAVRAAGRLVGRLYLEAGDIPQAWSYFRMLSEPEPIVQALEAYQPGTDENLQPLIQIALYEGILPCKGFDWLLERYGQCNAITTLSSHELPLTQEGRQYCIGRLVQSLYRELCERLWADIHSREEQSTVSAGTTPRLRDLLQGRDWIFEDSYAHIDTSHLSSVVQMSIFLPQGEELTLARELCEYGCRISTHLRYPSDPPFEDLYRDYGVYLAILAGDDVEEGLAHFRAKAENDGPETGTYPAEVLVNLLLRLDRSADALAAARRYLAQVDDGRPLTCPSIVELCQQCQDFRALAEIGRMQGNAIHFVAGLIAEKQQK